MSVSLLSPKVQEKVKFSKTITDGIAPSLKEALTIYTIQLYKPYGREEYSPQ